MTERAGAHAETDAPQAKTEPVEKHLKISTPEVGYFSGASSSAKLLGETGFLYASTGSEAKVADNAPAPAAAGKASATLTGAEAGRADIDFFRASLKQGGIDPDAPLKTLIGVYEPSQRFMEDPTPEHTIQVAGTMSDASVGFFRHANIKTITDPEKKIDASSYLSKPEGLKHLVSDFGVGVMDALSKVIKSQVVNGDVKVLNVSQAYTGEILANDLRFTLAQDPHKYAPFIKQILGNEKGDQLVRDMDDPDTRAGQLQFSEKTSELEKKLYVFVEDTLVKDASFKASNERYADITKQAADKGRYVVVAAGNFYYPGSDSESSYNWYARSNNVISMGGDVWKSNSNDPATHSLYFFSSLGTKTFHPTVVANAWAPMAFNLGTSFSTPRGSITIGAMLDQNPNLSFKMTKFLLEASAKPLPSVVEEFQGAGELQPDVAIRTARQFNEQTREAHRARR